MARNRLEAFGSLVQRWLYVLATGYALTFFSEWLFWGARSLSDALLTWLFYSLAVYCILLIVAHFRVNTLWSLFLAGAVYGWLTEGVLVQTVYQSLPVSISTTGLSWHALITVWVGWYAVRRALLRPGPARAWLWSLAVGVFAGLWLPFWAHDRTAGIAPFTPANLAALLGLAVPGLALSYWLQNRLVPRPFRAARLEAGLLAGLFLVQFAIGVVPTYPIALLVLPPLLAVVFAALRRHRQHGPRDGDYVEALAGPIPWRNLLGVLLIVPASIATFSLSTALGLTPYPQYALHLGTMLGGFGLLAVSLLKVWRPGTAAHRAPRIAGDDS